MQSLLPISPRSQSRGPDAPTSPFRVPRLGHTRLPGGQSAGQPHPSEGNSRKPTMPKASPPLGSPFMPKRAGEAVVWDRSHRQPD